MDVEQLNTEETINDIAERFRFGQVLAYPTDTVYGLGCLATDEQAVERIYRIKQRDENKPLLVLVSDMSMANNYCHINQEQKRYLRKYWPGPYSFILFTKNKLATNLFNNRQKIAVRLPNSGFLTKIIKKVGCPLVSTSLNISGEQPVTKADFLQGFFKKEKPDAVINIGEIDETKLSQVWDITDLNNIKILRS